MKLEMDGQFPLLPSAPAVGHEKTEHLQLMIREFMAVHYQLASGKEAAKTPWSSIAKYQSRLWDSEMWPSGVMVQDPSKIVLSDCQKIVTLWRERQADGGASHTFKFKFYLNSQGLQPGIYPTFTPTAAPIAAPTALAPTALTPTALLPTAPIAAPAALTPTALTLTALLPTPPAGVNIVSSPQMAESLFRAPSLPPHDMEFRDADGGLERDAEVGHGTPPDTGVATLPMVTDPNLVPGGFGVGQDLPEEPESDPPLRKGKQRKQYTMPSSGDESDPTSEPGGREGQRKNNHELQRSLRNISPEPTYENDESLPPRLAAKGRRKGKKAKSRRNAPAAETSGGEDDTRPIQETVSKRVSKPNPRKKTKTDKPTAGNTHEDTAGGKDDTAPIQLQNSGRIKPKPKPVKKRTDKGKVHETQAEELEREDNLFIVRKSGRAPKPKFNVAPPPQLRLEKEREANRNKENNQ